ncbi:MAG: hypothetical protein JWQ35_17 [Bacteriovoracaceae bacterium]|nr:hypothetical protein [Bacteriovoracaceae bacterium]
MNTTSKIFFIVFFPVLLNYGSVLASSVIDYEDMKQHSETEVVLVQAPDGDIYINSGIHQLAIQLGGGEERNPPRGIQLKFFKNFTGARENFHDWQQSLSRKKVPLMSGIRVVLEPKDFTKLNDSLSAWKSETQDFDPALIEQIRQAEGRKQFAAQDYFSGKRPIFANSLVQLSSYLMTGSFITGLFLKTLSPLQAGILFSTLAGPGLLASLLFPRKLENYKAFANAPKAVRLFTYFAVGAGIPIACTYAIRHLIKS